MATGGYMGTDGQMVHEMGGQTQQLIATYGATTPSTQAGTSPMTYGAPTPEPTTVAYRAEPTACGTEPVTYGAPQLEILNDMMPMTDDLPEGFNDHFSMTYGVPSPLMTYHGPGHHGAHQPLSPVTPPSIPSMTYGAPAPPPMVTYGAPSPTVASVTYGAPRQHDSGMPLAPTMAYSVTKSQPVTVSPEEFAKGHGALVHVSGFVHEGSAVSLESKQQGTGLSSVCPTCSRPWDGSLEDLCCRDLCEKPEEKKKTKAKLTHKKKNKNCC
jgi:hypothetical protein